MGSCLNWRQIGQPASNVEKRLSIERWFDFKSSGWDSIYYNPLTGGCQKRATLHHPSPSETSACSWFSRGRNSRSECMSRTCSARCDKDTFRQELGPRSPDDAKSAPGASSGPPVKSAFTGSSSSIKPRAPIASPYEV